MHDFRVAFEALLPFIAFGANYEDPHDIDFVRPLQPVKGHMLSLRSAEPNTNTAFGSRLPQRLIPRCQRQAGRQRHFKIESVVAG
jgi:hypothetical protein